MSSAQVLALDTAAFGEAKGLRRGEDVMDALAYIDGLNAKAKANAEALIKEEVLALSPATTHVHHARVAAYGQKNQLLSLTGISQKK